MAIVKKVDGPELLPLTEAVIVDQVASNFDVWRNRALPNIHLCGGEMDLAIITPSRYLWEVEAKLTLSDWKADERKSKWRHPDRKYVSRFYYAVPLELVDRRPDFVPESAGILGIYYHNYWGWSVKDIRLATGKRGEKITEAMFNKFIEKAYFKYWRRRFKENYTEPLMTVEHL